MNKTLLEQAIVDAKLLRESALKAAETEVLNKYADEIKESVFRFLEQDQEEDPFAAPGPDLGLGGMEDPDGMPIDPAAAAVPLAAADGEQMCSCPDEDEEVEIDFGNIETDMAQEPQTDMAALPGEDEELQEGGNDYRVQLPESMSGRLVPYAEVLGKDSAIGQTLEMVLEGSAIPRDLLEMCLKELQDLAFQGYDDAGLTEVANELGGYFEPEDDGMALGEGEVDVASSKNDILSQIADLDKELEEVVVEEEEEIDFMLMDALIADLENTPTGKLGGGINDREVNDKNDIASVLDAADDVLGGNPLVAPKRRDVPSTPPKPEKAGGNVPSADKYDDDNVKMLKRLREMEEQVSSLRTRLSQMEEENNGLKGIVQESKKKLEGLSFKNVKLAYMYEVLASGASLNERAKKELVEAIQNSSSVSDVKSLYEKGMSSTADVDEFRSLIKENRFSILKKNRENNTPTNQLPDEIKRLQEMAGIKNK